MKAALAAFCLAAIAIASIVVIWRFADLGRSDLVGAFVEDEATAAKGDRVASIAPRAARPAANDPPASMPAPPPAPITPKTVLPRSGELVAPAERNVTAPGMTPAPRVDGPLERQPLPKKPPPPPRWQRFAHVVVVEPGLIDLGKRKVRLAHLKTALPDRDCKAGDGAAPHPCATMALAALRARIRALAVECQLATPDAERAPCRLGKTDLALWMVEQGWAEPAKDAPDAYRTALTEARCAGRGLWAGKERPADCGKN